MKIKLKDYQLALKEDAVDALVGILQKNKADNIIVIKGPTGSGKTPTLGETLRDTFIKYPKSTVVLATPAQGGLEDQLFAKLTEQLKGQVDVSLVSEQFFRNHKHLPEKHILVIGWQSILSTGNTGKKSNKAHRLSEYDSNLTTIMERTRNNGTKIILAIDEAHTIATSENAHYIRDQIIKPHATLETCATPLFWNKSNYRFEMQYSDAVKEGVVKKFAYINLFDRKNKITVEYLLEQAVGKNRWLRRKLEALKRKVNPLMGIQIPNGAKGELLYKQLIKLLAESGITVENGKLAIWTDRKKENLEGIKNNDSPVEVILFKQAVAVGWDCPRAYVWLNLRPNSNQIFSIQTCGRFLRMAELFHYEDEDLNCAYIYTDDSSYKISPDDIEYLGDVDFSKKVLDTKDTNFKIKYESRAGNYNDYESEKADPILYNQVKKRLGLTSNIEKNREILKKQGFNLKPPVVQRTILKNTKVASEAFVNSGVIEPDDLAKFVAEPEILNQTVKDFFSQALNAHGMAAKRSGSRPRNSVFKIFQKLINPEITTEEFNKIMAYAPNAKKIMVPFTETLGKLKSIRKDIKNKILTDNWTPPEEQVYNTNTYKIKSGTGLAAKHLYQPYRSQKLEDPEEQFHLWLTEQGWVKKIEWWFHNGKNRKRDLGLPYNFEGLEKLTYPDRLIKSLSSNYLLLEIKHETDPDGFTKTTAKAKGIQDWIKVQRKSGMPVYGGIVIQFKGKWMINTEAKYNWSKVQKGDLSDWELLDNFLKRVM